jgi:hypothetical protein
MTPNVKLCPAPRLTGSDKPVGVKAALDEAACDTVMLVVPVFIKIPVIVCEPPAGRFPKLRLAGEAAIEPALAPDIPEPDRDTVPAAEREDLHL